MYPLDSFGTSLIFNIINSCFFSFNFWHVFQCFLSAPLPFFTKSIKLCLIFCNRFLGPGSLQKSSSLSSMMTSCFVTFPSCLGRALGTACLPRILYTLLALLVTCMVICQIFSVLWKTYFSWETRKTVKRWNTWTGMMEPFFLFWIERGARADWANVWAAFWRIASFVFGILLRCCQELIMLKIKEVPKLSMGYMMSFWFCLDRYTVTNTKITWAFGS